MVVISYIISLLGFQLSYLAIHFVIVVFIGRIYFLKTKSELKLRNFPLLVLSFLCTYLSLSFSNQIFSWFHIEPNLWILTPFTVIIWFTMARKLYRTEFHNGAAHWGMALGVANFLV